MASDWVLRAAECRACLGAWHLLLMLKEISEGSVPGRVHSFSTLCRTLCGALHETAGKVSLSRTFPTRRTEDDAACGERKVADGLKVQRRRRGCRSSLRLPRWSQTSGMGYEIENRSHLRMFRWSLSANIKEREPLFISVWKGHVAGRSGQAIPAAGRRRAQAVFNDIHKLRVTDFRIFARS